MTLSACFCEAEKIRAGLLDHEKVWTRFLDLEKLGLTVNANDRISGMADIFSPSTSASLTFRAGFPTAATDDEALC